MRILEASVETLGNHTAPFPYLLTDSDKCSFQDGKSIDWIAQLLWDQIFWEPVLGVGRGHV